MTDLTPSPSFINGPHGRIAYLASEGAGPGVVWLGGFKSDMTGTKAAFLHDRAIEQGRAFLRFDYSGHGASEGVFEDCAISDWLADAECALDRLTKGPQILVGSSMGGWIAALLALRRPARVAGVLFIAPAPDFTERLMWAQMDAETRADLLNNGRIEEPTDYSDEPNVITRRLIEDGRHHQILGGPIAINAPIHILQGMADPDVPYGHALDFMEKLTSDDVVITMTKSGDHRLSTPADLERLGSTLNELITKIEAS